LLAVARECGLELVFKLHPFESAVGHRRMLRRYLDAQTTAAIRIIVGPSPPQLWQLTKCALTVQSTVALECSRRGIPVFLCGWLADACAGYVQQFERFGFGRVLRTPSEFEQVPGWIASPAETRLCKRNAEPLDPKILRQLLQAAYSRAELASA
jgi:capsule polysaccharide modification protein KpsS